MHTRARVCMYMYVSTKNSNRKHKGKDHIYRSNRTNKINPLEYTFQNLMESADLYLLIVISYRYSIIYLTSFLLIAI